MTILHESPATPAPRAGYVPRLPRRHEIVSTGGMDGVLRIGSALQTCGYQVTEFTADVREGVLYSSVTCTVALSGEEATTFAERLRELPTVVSVEPW